MPPAGRCSTARGFPKSAGLVDPTGKKSKRRAATSDLDVKLGDADRYTVEGAAWAGDGPCVGRRGGSRQEFGRIGAKSSAKQCLVDGLFCVALNQRRTR